MNAKGLVGIEKKERRGGGGRALLIAFGKIRGKRMSRILSTTDGSGCRVFLDSSPPKRAFGQRYPEGTSSVRRYDCDLLQFITNVQRPPRRRKRRRKIELRRRKEIFPCLVRPSKRVIRSESQKQRRFSRSNSPTLTKSATCQSFIPLACRNSLDTENSTRHN